MLKRLLRLSVIRENLRILAWAGIWIFLPSAGVGYPGWATPACGENYIQQFETGRVDWSNGIAEAWATGSPPEQAGSPAQGRALAETEAKQRALSRLIGILQSIRIDSKKTVRETLERRGEGNRLETAVLRESWGVEKSLLADGSVRVTLAIRLNGVFADLVLPKTLVVIKTVVPSETKNETHSGLIVDCRGLSLEPAMVPMVTSEDGQVVYATGFVSRDYAMSGGVVAYARGSTGTMENPRVGSNPLIVKGLKTEKTGSCDVVISNADAARVKGGGSNISFLHKGRVLFLME